MERIDKNRELPASRVSGKVLYELGQIEAFIEGSNSHKTSNVANTNISKHVAP